MVRHGQKRVPWWKRGVIYQIYPRSFQDSDADGVGDLAGIESRLDYLAALGVDALWLSPIFPSPMADFGYDITDYCGIDSVFGDLAGFDRLLAAVHARGLKLLLDFVPNHSSDQHPWFIESRASRESPKRDWYVWRDPAPDGGPPNNWISDFGGSSWEWDEATDQYYLHAFLKSQPDLNWRSLEVREAMMAVLRFWLDRGVDGFRIDVLWHIIKAATLPDNPINPDWRPGRTQRDQLIQLYSTDQPEAHAISAEFRELADSYCDRVLIGEIALPNERLARWYGTPGRPQVHLPFNFQLVEKAWDAATLWQTIRDYELSLPEFGWPNWVMGSHDAARIAARVGDAQARVAAMLLLTLRGTPTLYQGDEIGIGEVTIPPDRVRDPQDLRQPGLGIGRDRSRTPIPWDASAYAGFSTVEPWLPLNEDWRERNVAAQDRKPDSLLSLYRTLLTLRRSYDALAIGDIKLVDAAEDVLAFQRRHAGVCLQIMLNLCGETRPLMLPTNTEVTEVLATTLLPSTSNPTHLSNLLVDGRLAPDEGLVLRLKEKN